MTNDPSTVGIVDVGVLGGARTPGHGLLAGPVDFDVVVRGRRVIEVRLSPDGGRYLELGTRKPQPAPFHYRWLVPALCKDIGRRWILSTYLSLVAVCLLGSWWVRLHDFGWQYQVAAPLLVLSLAGVTHFNLRFPVLIDLPAMALGLGAACCWKQGLWPAALVLVLLCGCVKESTPVFVALWAWTPLLAVGLLSPLIRYLIKRPEKTDDQVLRHPFQASQEQHKGHWQNPYLMVLPWGGLLAALGHPTLALALTVAVAYAQVLVATDTVRLYQWAWPSMLLAACGVMPVVWIVPIVVASVFNPWRGTGL